MDIGRLAALSIALTVLASVAAGADIPREDPENNCENIIGAHLNGNNECECEDKDEIIDSSKSHCISVAFDGYGAACNDSVQCAHRMDAGGVCFDKKCICADGYHYLKGRCWRDKKHGEKCSSSEECYAFFESDAYVCEDSICKCAEDTYLLREQNGYEICRRIARENEECELDMDCEEGSNLTCVKADFLANDYICKKIAQENTIENEEINAARYEKSYITNARRFRTNPKGDVDNTGKRANPTEDEECSGEFEKKTPGGKCICKLGYYRVSGAGECVPELGQPCSLEANRAEGLPSIENSACRRSAKLKFENNDDEGIWACLGAFLPRPGNRECVKTRKYGENCPEGGVMCATFGGICQGSSCVCPSKFHYAPYKFVCWPSKGLYESCEDDADCGVITADSIYCDFGETNSVREEGKCLCKPGFHEVTNELDCRKDATELDQACTDVHDCTFANEDPKIICRAARCRCNDGYFKFNTTYCETGITGKCTYNRDCAAVKNSNCNLLTKQCECDTGYVVSSGNFKTCYPEVTEYGGECEDSVQCENLTPDQDPVAIYCSESANPPACLCYPEHHFRNNTCWPTSKLNERCTKQSQCVAENAVCRNSFCTCDYYFRSNGENCTANGAYISWPSPLTALLVPFVTSTLRYFVSSA